MISHVVATAGMLALVIIVLIVLIIIARWVKEDKA